MDSTEYTQLAIKTESVPDALKFSTAGLLRALEVLASAAAVADKMKRHLYYGDKGALNEAEFRDLLLNLSSKVYVLANLSSGGRLTRPSDTPEELSQPNLRVLHAGLGLFSESGEVLEALIEQIKTGSLDLVNVGEEGGDSLWYGAVLADATGVSMAQNMETNIAKLKKRYGEKFSSEAATNRDLVGERQVLEDGLSTAAANDSTFQEEKAA